MTRRRLQIALGALWLLDGLLQAQPFMFTRGFATQVIAPAGQGQPGFVSAPVHWVANIVAAHPVVWNVPFAAIQLALGVGLLVPRTARLALAASIGWGLGVWYLGEGLSGLAGGDASLAAGAPGTALLYAILAAAAWPHRDASTERPGRWLPFAWAAVWVGGAVFAASQQVDAAIVAAEYLIGVGALARPTRPAAVVVAGLVLSLAFWVATQDLGGLTSGQATDPDTGPVLALLAIAVLAPAATSRPALARRRRRGGVAVQAG